ncbi:DUF6161 domain-containing protein [Vibrio parahaemolyticus]|nr:hypothetical protein [Vibrio parahaemolyticus]
MDKDEVYELKGLFGTALTFDSIMQLQSFVNNELEQFNNYQDSVYQGKSVAINTIRSNLVTLKRQVDLVVKTLGQYNQAPAQTFKNLDTQIERLASVWAPHDHPVFIRSKQIYHDFGTNGEEVFWLNVTGGFKQPINHLQMMGALSAYEFLSNRHSLVEVSNTDRDFIEENYNKAVTKGNELESFSVKLQERVSLWEDNCQHEWNEWQDTCNSTWSSLTEEKNAEWEKEKTSFNTERLELLEGATKKLCDLETAYQEHLKLEKPAKYWSDAAKRYSDAGAWWGAVLALLVLVGIVGFVHFYSKFLMGQELGVSLDTVKGVVLFVTGITVYGFLIRVVSRLLMSTIHLQRDSEERAQLTYFYLSLIKDGAIDEDSRNIVIQSLFSRTETGLITGDSSPTMPTVDVLKNIKLGN